MMKGCLRLIVLKELLEGDKTGYLLITGLERCFGRRPSAGSVYPLMEGLHKDGLVKSMVSGRKKIYSITTKGKKAVIAILKEKEDFLLGQLELVRSFTAGKSCEDLAAHMRLSDEIASKGDRILRNIDIWSDLRSSIVDLIVSPGFERCEPQARRILSEAISRIDALKRDA